ncbi:hypothetical protein AURANDRAFT_68555, partial [Aureococcus anophagefferens]
MRRAQFAKNEAPRIAAVWLRAAATQVADSRRRRAKKAEIEAARAAAPVGQRTRHVEPLPPTFAVKVPIRGLVKGVWRDGTATVLTASFAYDRDDGERKEAPLLNAEEMMPIVVDEPPDGADDDDDDVEEESVPVRVRATEASFEVVDVRPAAAADAFKRMAAKLRASRPKPATVLEDAGLEAPPYIALRSRGSPKTPSLFRSDEDLSFSASEPTFRTNCTGNVCSVQHKEDVKLVRSGVSLRDCNIGIPGVAALLDLPAAAATVLEEELKPTEAGKILADMLPPKVLPCVVGHLIEKGAIPKTCAVAAFGGSVGGGTAQVVAVQRKGGKDVVDSVDDAYDESKGRPTFGVVTNSCEPWTTCSEFYKDVPLALRPGVWHTPAIIQRLISRDSKGKLAGGLIENSPEFAPVFLRHKELHSPWWWTKKMLMEAGFHVLAFAPLPMQDVGYSNKRKRAIVVFYRAAPGSASGFRPDAESPNQTATSWDQTCSSLPSLVVNVRQWGFDPTTQTQLLMVSGRPHLGVATRSSDIAAAKSTIRRIWFGFMCTMWLRMLPVVALGASLNISDIVTFSSRDFTTQTTATSAANETAAFLLNGGGGGGGAAGGGFGGGMGDGPPDGPGRGGGARRSDDILVFGMNFEIGEVARGVLPGVYRVALRGARGVRGVRRVRLRGSRRRARHLMRGSRRRPDSPDRAAAGDAQTAGVARRLAGGAAHYAAHYAAAARRAAAGLLRLAGRMCKRRGAADATLAVGVGGPSAPDAQATTTAAKAKAAKKKRAGPFIAKAKAAKKKKKKRGGTCPAATTTTAEVNGRDVGVYEEAGVEGAKARIAEFMENLDDRFISLYGGGSGRNLDGALDRMWSHTRILNNVGWLGLADADGNVNSVLIKVTGLHNGDANGKATAEATEAILLDHALTFSGLSPANVNKAGANVFIDKDGSMWFYLCAATVPARGKRDLAELARRAGKKPPSKWVLKTDKRSRGVCKRSRGVDAASRGVAKKVSSTWTQAMDDAIVSLVESSGGVDGVSSADWKSLATRLGKVKVDSFGKRRYNTCRLRYVEHLDPTRITGSFSVTEMRVVYEAAGLARATSEAPRFPPPDDGDEIHICWRNAAGGSVGGGYWRAVVATHPVSGQRVVYGRDRDAGWWDEPVPFDIDADDWRPATPAPVETPPSTTPAPVETPPSTTPAPVETTPAPVETTPAPVETTPSTTTAPVETPAGGWTAAAVAAVFQGMDFCVTGNFYGLKQDAVEAFCEGFGGFKVTRVDRPGAVLIRGLKKGTTEPIKSNKVDVALAAGATIVEAGVFGDMVGGGADLNLGKDGVRAMVESFGGRVTGAVSGKTDILIVGKEPGMSKVSKARAANVTLMTLHDLKLGIAHGDVLAAAQPVVIKVFSAGYGGNGLALGASDAEYAFAAGVAQQPTVTRQRAPKASRASKTKRAAAKKKK